MKENKTKICGFRLSEDEKRKYLELAKERGFKNFSELIVAALEAYSKRFAE